MAVDVTIKADVAQLKAALDVLTKDMKELQTETKKETTDLKQMGSAGVKGVSAVHKEMAAINSTVSKTSQMFSTLGTTIVAAFGVQQITHFLKSSVDAYLQAQAGEAKLRNSYIGREEVANRLIKQAKELQKVTVIEDDAIIAQQAFLAAQGRTEVQINKTIKAATEMSAVLGVDLETAVRMLDGTMEGNIGRLGKYDDRLKKLSKSQLENGAAIDILNEKYDGFAANLAGTTSGQLQQLENNFGNTKEALGGFIAELLTASGLMPELNARFSSLNDILDSQESSIMKLSAVWDTFNTGVLSTILTKTKEVETKQAEALANMVMSGKTSFKAQIEDVKFWQQSLKESLEDGAIDEKTYTEQYEQYVTRRMDLIQRSMKIVTDIGDKHAEERIEGEGKTNEELLKKQEEYAKKLIAANEALNKRLKDLDLELMDDGYKKMILANNMKDEEIEKGIGSEKLKNKVILKEEELLFKQIEKMQRENTDVVKEELDKIKDLYKKHEDDKLTALLESNQKIRDAGDKVLSDSEKFLEDSKNDPKYSSGEYLMAQLFGIDDMSKVKEVVDNTFGIALPAIQDNLEEALSAYAEFADKRVELFDKMIAENQQAILIEQNDRDAGFANDVELLKQRDADLQRQREEALKKQAQANRIQIALDSAMQLSDLATASANIFKYATSEGAIFGVPIALGLIATMFAAFIASKAKALQVAKLEHGGTGVLEGKSHRQGGVPFMDGYEAEGGERWAVFSKDATKRNPGLSTLIKAVNDGSLVIDKDRMAALAAGTAGGVIVNFDGGEHLEGMHNIMKHDKSRKFLPNGTVRIGIITRKINK